MLNRIWFWFMLIGILYGPVRMVVVSYLPDESPPPAPSVVQDEAVAPDAASGVQEAEPALTVADVGQQINEAMLDAAQLSVDICLSLIAIMVLWLGLMQIAKDAGLVAGLAKLLRPLMRWLFPGVPDDHPAQGAMLMNISANMLGLDNAATPFGLKAMRELDTLNKVKGTATNAMATFLTINTSSVTLVPISIIALRLASGSEDASAPVFGILLATLASTVVGITTVRLLSKLPVFSMERAVSDQASQDATDEEEGR